MCTKIKPFYLMVKTGNRIYKISVRKFTTNQNFISFYSVFFFTVYFQLWPGTRTLSFLTMQPQTFPPPPPPPPSRLTHFKSVSGLYISTENMYARKYISVCLSISFFSSVFKVSGIFVYLFVAMLFLLWFTLLLCMCMCVYVSPMF